MDYFGDDEIDSARLPESRGQFPEGRDRPDTSVHCLIFLLPE